MLALLTILLISGPLNVWAAGRDIHIFHWFSIASQIGEVAWLEIAAEQLHGKCANLLMLFVLIHASAALYHLFFKDDDVFIRMLGPKKARDVERT